MKHLMMAAAVCIAGAGSAGAGVFYDCDMDTKIKNGWVSSKIGIVIDDAGKVTVIDSIILNVIGEPLTARATQRGDRMRITWNIANAKDSRGQHIPTFRYVANLNTKTQAISVSAKPVVAPQRWSAKGTCKLRSK